MFEAVLSLLGGLAMFLVRDKDGKEEERHLFNDRLLVTPTIALEQAKNVTFKMSRLAERSGINSISLFEKYDKRIFDSVIEDENKIDAYEDEIGSYLVKITSCDLDEIDNLEATKLLHTISDLERLSDHCSNIAGCIIEIAHNSLGMHGYTRNVKSGNELYDDYFKSYSDKYKLAI